MSQLGGPPARPPPPRLLSPQEAERQEERRAQQVGWGHLQISLRAPAPASRPGRSQGSGMWGVGIASEVSIKGSRHLQITGTPPSYPRTAPSRHWARNGAQHVCKMSLLSVCAWTGLRPPQLPCPPPQRWPARLPSVCWLQRAGPSRVGMKVGTRGEHPDLGSRGNPHPPPGVPQRGGPSRSPTRKVGRGK